MGDGKGRPIPAAVLFGPGGIAAEAFEILAERRWAAPVELSADATGLSAGVVIVAAAPADGRTEPRVTWQAEPGRLRAHLAVSIGGAPAVLDDGGLKPAGAARVTPELLAWTKVNHKALVAFWDDGASWSARRVEKWRAGLKPVAGRRAGRA